jgi:Fe-S-cluster containining protein
MEPSEGDAILDKYGLSELRDKPLRLWTDCDYEGVLNACARENMAPRLPILFNDDNIARLLEKSCCQGCGRCCGCGGDPIGTNGPGVFVFEAELDCIKKQSPGNWKQLEARLIRHEEAPRAWFMPFPCIFRKGERCQVYEARPFACRAFPLSNYQINDKYYIAVNVQCEYGRDLYKAALAELAAGYNGRIPYES